MIEATSNQKGNNSFTEIPNHTTYKFHPNNNNRKVIRINENSANNQHSIFNNNIILPF